MLYTIVIYDTDTDFASNFIHYVKSKYKNYSLHLFTNRKHLEEYLMIHNVSLLLVNDSIEMREDYKIGRIVILWDGMKEIKAGEEIYPHILKYQSAKLILEELNTYLPKKEGIIIGREKERAKILCVYSNDNKKMASLFTYFLAYEYAKKKRVLLINLDKIQVLGKLLQSKEEHSLSQFIYYLKQKNSNLRQKAKDLITKLDNMSILYGVSSWLDIYDISEEDVTLWISELSLWKEYDIIMFHVDTLTKGLLSLLTSSDEIHLLQGEDDLDKLESKLFQEQLTYMGMIEVVEKIHMVTLTKSELEKYNKWTLDKSHEIQSFLSVDLINNK